MGRVVPGMIISVFGVVMLAISWKFRHVVQLDEDLQKQLDEALKLEKKDPSAAHAMIDKVVAEDERRREAELADLRARAATDRRAARQLRSRLLGKLENTRSARRKLERTIEQAPHTAPILAELSRDESTTEQELDALEQFLDQPPT